MPGSHDRVFGGGDGAAENRECGKVGRIAGKSLECPGRAEVEQVVAKGRTDDADSAVRGCVDGLRDLSALRWAGDGEGQGRKCGEGAAVESEASRRQEAFRLLYARQGRNEGEL